MKFLQVLDLTTKIAQIKRTVGYRNKHLENDAEHSYQVAMVAWSVNQQYKLGLSDELILKFGLVHDLVEIYAGDVDAFDSKKKIANKKENEHKALEKIKQEYTDLGDLVSYIERYELKQDPEAMLVYILDKVIPDVHIYRSQSNYHKRKKVTLEIWEKWFFGKFDYESLDAGLKKVVDDAVLVVRNDYVDIFYSV